jgi:hypothetical protein
VPPIASSIEILHGNILVGSTDGHVLEFQLNSEEDFKEEQKKFWAEHPVTRTLLQNLRAAGAGQVNIFHLS